MIVNTFKIYIIKTIKNFCIWYITRYGFIVLEKKYTYPWQRLILSKASYNKNSILPNKALEYLVYDNPRLKILKKKYFKFIKELNLVSETLLWKDGYLIKEDLLYFRGDNPYVWQKRGVNSNLLSYALTYYWILKIDKKNLLNKCIEDDSFGIYSFKIDNRLISRDLLDSINEIIFLNQYVFDKEEKINILDIGAGYGRLAHRATDLVSQINKYYCTDAVPESTFLSEYYIGHRKIEDKVQIIPFDEFENNIDSLNIDLMINIHSFSEMEYKFIEYWISLISSNKIKYLFLVPNTKDNYGKKLISFDGYDFQNLIEESGYDLIINEPKYCEPIVQKYGISPTHYYLFKNKIQ